jgi:hypothetical protein
VQKTSIRLEVSFYPGMVQAGAISSPMDVFCSFSVLEVSKRTTPVFPGYFFRRPIAASLFSDLSEHEKVASLLAAADDIAIAEISKTQTSRMGTSAADDMRKTGPLLLCSRR